MDLFKDLILVSDRQLDAARIIECTIPSLSKSCKYLPVYKHLKEIGIDSEEEYKNRGYDIDRHVGRTPAEFSTTTYARQFVQTEREKTTQEIIATNPPEKAAIFLTFIKKEKFDHVAVREFLAANIDKLDGLHSSYSTSFRKAACLYDYFVYGWN